MDAGGPLGTMDIVRERARLDEMHRNRVEDIKTLEVRRDEVLDPLSGAAKAELAEIEQELVAKHAAITSIEAEQEMFELMRLWWREEERRIQTAEVEEARRRAPWLNWLHRRLHERLSDAAADASIVESQGGVADR